MLPIAFKDSLKLSQIMQVPREIYPKIYLKTSQNNLNLYNIWHHNETKILISNHSTQQYQAN